MLRKVCSVTSWGAVALCSIVVVSGCDQLGIGSGRVIDNSNASLKAFESEGALEDYLQSQLQAQSQRMDGTVVLEDGFTDGVAADGAADLGGAGGRAEVENAPAPVSDQSGNTVLGESADGDDFSGTTTQESGVDEADVVKTDGRYIYVLSHGTLKIIQAVPAETMATVGEVDIEGYGRDMYLRDGQVTILSDSYSGFIALPVKEEEIAVDSDEPIVVDSTDDVDIDVISLPYEPVRPGAMVTVVDVSEPDNPVVLSKTRFDGNVASSRMIDGELHLVLATYDYFYYDIMPRYGQTDFDPTAVDSDAILPSFAHSDQDGNVTEGKALTWESLYRPTEPDGFGVVTVVSMQPSAALEFKAVGVLAQPGNVYSSKETLYLTDTDYDFSGNVRETTNIYKFVYGEDGPVPVAAGAVPGRVLNQYSMGEHNGFLRVATTQGPQFGFAGQVAPSTNQVYVLEEVEGELAIVGSVEDIAEGESIQSARFVGDRGFV
ncbi:MAG: beta-propeller domain-containing protein, partial [Phycisphaerae bacterium]